MQTIIDIAGDRAQFFGSFPWEFHIVVLLALLSVAMISDIRGHRIPNWLVAAGTVFAFVYHATTHSGEGALFTLTGLAVGIAVLIPLYALGTMGAGDVKLMGMVGAYLGTAEVLSAVIATLIAGGAMALLVSAYKRALPQLVMNLHTMAIQRHIRQLGGTLPGTSQPLKSVGKLPYAVAIAAGTICQLFWLRGA